jgi:2-polyprenyl-3-methyl-5-hydroxy-6-metoxy-1,4-benzoquinol methylase
MPLDKNGKPIRNAVKAKLNNSKLYKHFEQQQMNKDLGLPPGVNWEGEANLLDFSLNPRTAKFPDMMRQFCIAHMAGYYGGFEQPDHTVRILDAGAGFGELWHIINPMRKAAGVRVDYVAIDVDPRKQDLAVEMYPKMDYRLGDFTVEFDDLVPERDFDVVLSTEVLEHLAHNDGKNYLEDCMSRLRGDGVLLLTTPNEEKQTTNPWHLYEWPNQELHDFFLERGYEIVDKFYMRPRVASIDEEIALENRKARMPSEILRAVLFGDAVGAISVFVVRNGKR